MSRIFTVRFSSHSYLHNPLVHRLAVLQSQKAGVKSLDRFFVLHPDYKDLVYFQQVVMHLVGRLPVDLVAAPGVKNDLNLFSINMIADPKRGCLEGFVMDKADLAASVNDKTYVHGPEIPRPIRQKLTILRICAAL